MEMFNWTGLPPGLTQDKIEKDLKLKVFFRCLIIQVDIHTMTKLINLKFSGQ